MDPFPHRPAFCPGVGYPLSTWLVFLSYPAVFAGVLHFVFAAPPYLSLRNAMSVYCTLLASNCWGWGWGENAAGGGDPFASDLFSLPGRPVPQTFIPLHPWGLRALPGTRVGGRTADLAPLPWKPRQWQEQEAPVFPTCGPAVPPSCPVLPATGLPFGIAAMVSVSRVGFVGICPRQSHKAPYFTASHTGVYALLLPS